MRLPLRAEAPVCACLFLAAFGASAQAAPAQTRAEADAAQAQFVQEVLNTPVDELDDADISKFIYAVAPLRLPVSLQEAYMERRNQILDEGLHRQIDFTPAPKVKPAERKEKEPDLKTSKGLLAAGYEEITETELVWLRQQTKCSVKQLEENSSLRVVQEVTPGQNDKKKASLLRYFLLPKDPLFAAVAGYRSGRKQLRGTAFFGAKSKSLCGQ